MHLTLDSKHVMSVSEADSRRGEYGLPRQAQHTWHSSISKDPVLGKQYEFRASSVSSLV